MPPRLSDIPKQHVVSVRVDDRTYGALSDVARATGAGRSLVVRAALTTLLFSETGDAGCRTRETTNTSAG